jgi:hypothetical protein
MSAKGRIAAVAMYDNLIWLAVVSWTYPKLPHDRLERLSGKSEVQSALKRGRGRPCFTNAGTALLTSVFQRTNFND